METVEYAPQNFCALIDPSSKMPGFVSTGWTAKSAEDRKRQQDKDHQRGYGNRLAEHANECEEEHHAEQRNGDCTGEAQRGGRRRAHAHFLFTVHASPGWVWTGAFRHRIRPNAAQSFDTDVDERSKRPFNGRSAEAFAQPPKPFLVRRGER